MAIHAHLVGKAYGTRPTDVLDSPAWRFWMDAQVRAAGAQFEQERAEQRRRDDGAGVATDREKADLVDAQERRADRRDRQDGQPDLDDQLAALEGDD